MSARFQVGDRVNVAAVYEWPPETAWEDGDHIQLVPVPNERADQVAVVVGVSNRRYRSAVCENTEGRFYREWLDGTKTFYVVRYTLRGRRYYTLPEHMVAVDGVKEAVES